MGPVPSLVYPPLLIEKPHSADLLVAGFNDVGDDGGSTSTTIRQALTPECL
jgi:hypothetical protein